MDGWLMADDLRKRIVNYLLNDSIPAGMAKSAWSGFTLPGDVLAGRARPDDIGRSLDFAGVPMLGSMAVPAATNEMRMGIKAYHGTPHNFDKFDVSKIGTGEGTQAYGRGIYLAENENVAKFYRDSISDLFASPETLAKHYTDQYGGAAASTLSRHADTNAAGYMQKDIDQLRAAANLLNNGFDTAAVKPAGHMYEVNINASPDDFLEWRPELSRALDDPKEIEKLKQQGVAGVKYDDAGSRGTGSGTKNYVVFDDRIIDIVRKYGISGALAAGLLTQEQADALWSNGA